MWTNFGVYSLGPLPPGAIVLAAHPEQEVVENQPEADVGINVVAVNQPMTELPEAGNTNKFTSICIGETLQVINKTMNTWK